METQEKRNRDTYITAEWMEEKLDAKRTQVERERAKLPVEVPAEERAILLQREIDVSKRKIAEYEDKIAWHRNHIEELEARLNGNDDFKPDTRKLGKFEADLEKMQKIADAMAEIRDELAINLDMFIPEWNSKIIILKNMERSFKSAKGPKI